VPRIQLRMMGALAALVVVVVAASGIVAERGLRRTERAQLERSLAQRAALVRDAVRGRPLDPRDRPALDALADRLGGAAGARVTLIAPDGSVVGDSEVALERLPEVESHAGRPEVKAALRAGSGTSRRLSDTVGHPFLYLALPAREGDPTGGVVRLAVGLEQIEAAVAELRQRLWIAGGIGLAGALVLSFLLSWLTLRPVEELRDVVSAIAAGQLDRRLRWRSKDELGEIARSINRMAEQLRLRLDEATAEKEQLEAVLASMADGVLVLGRDDRILLANPRWRELLSVWGEVHGRRPIEVARHAGVGDTLVAAAGTRETVVREVEVAGPEPRRLQIHAVGFPTDGPRAGTVAVFHDVTELRRLEQVRRDFIANASHELRTPLTAIRGFADTLLLGPVSAEELKPMLEAIARNGERLGNLVDDLLELSRIESRKHPLQPSEVDVPRLVRLLLRDLEPRLRDAQLRAELAADPPPAPAWADPRALEQVLGNLLDNAVKYTNPGGSIRVRVTSQDAHVRVAVSDSGIGIPEAERGRIFERFYRVDQARSRALGGTGLGLAIVKHLVQGMGGEIFVESAPGRGSSFTFTLPTTRP
jgi:two-component system, OmpR family, phosphate regulon sensor histidine kinase PhoR